MRLATPASDEERRGGVWVVGGEEMYRRSLHDFGDNADSIHLTVLDDGTSKPATEEMEGAKFPNHKEWAGFWELQDEWTGKRSGEDGIEYVFQVWGCNNTKI